MPAELTDPARELAIAPLWRQAFRPFFLLGSAFSVLAMALWAATLSGQLVFHPHGGSLFWHAHEMLFGFVIAIVAGFLLTAVQNWTGLRATHGRPLAALVGLWLAGRVLMITGGPLWLVAGVELAFVPAVALCMARLVLRAGNHRNLVFLPVLLLLAAANLLTHLSVGLQRPEWLAWGTHAAVFLVVVLMAVIGGRVMPMFTANGTGTIQVPPLPWLEKLAVASVAAIALIHILGIAAVLGEPVLSTLFALAAVSNGWRALRWRPWITGGVPLLWSLHLAYWFIPLGMCLFALHVSGLGVTASTALHALTAGAMGSMILAMIARVSLGHSGRPLTCHPAMGWAFAAVLLAGLARVASGLFPALFSSTGLLLPAALWLCGYTVFLAVYAAILLSPRPDGRPG